MDGAELNEGALGTVGLVLGKVEVGIDGTIDDGAKVAEVPFPTFPPLATDDNEKRTGYEKLVNEEMLHDYCADSPLRMISCQSMRYDWKVL